jgi:hypothetical protein
MFQPRPLVVRERVGAVYTLSAWLISSWLRLSAAVLHRRKDAGKARIFEIVYKFPVTFSKTRRLPYHHPHHSNINFSWLFSFAKTVGKTKFPVTITGESGKICCLLDGIFSCLLGNHATDCAAVCRPEHDYGRNRHNAKLGGEFPGRPH